MRVFHKMLNFSFKIQCCEKTWVCTILCAVGTCTLCIHTRVGRLCSSLGLYHLGLDLNVWPGEQAVFHQAKGWYVTNTRWWRVNNEMGCGLLTMFTVLEVERRSVLWKLLSDVLKLKKLDFLAVKVLGSLTEPANFWFSAQLTWLHSFNSCRFSRLSKCYWIK